MPITLLLAFLAAVSPCLADLTPTTETFEAGPVVVRGKRRPPQPAEQNLSPQESSRVPGSGGDVVRAVAALPGVEVPNDYLTNLLVRGGGPNDNQILLDGFRAAYPFHFGGVESVFSPAFLASASLLPSGYDVRYGDVQGAVLELSTKPPAAGTHGGFSLSEILAGIHGGQGGSGGNTGWQGGYRRGFFDLVIPAHKELTEVPRYQDYLAQARLAPWRGGELLLEAFGSQDSTSFYDPLSPGQDYGWESYFHTVGARLTQRLRRNWTMTSLASATLSGIKVNLTGQNITEAPYEWDLREEASQFWGLDQEINLGAEWHQTRTLLQGHFAQLPSELGSGFQFNQYPVVDIDALGSKSVLSAWAQDRWQAFSTLWLSAGGRFDWVDLTQDYLFSPRFSAEWKLGPALNQSLKAYYGDYFQSPQPLETVPGWQPVPLLSELTRTWGLAWEDRVSGGQSLRAELYHKDFSRFLPPTVAEVQGNTLTVNSTGTGFTDGAELTWRAAFNHGTFGWVSYSYTWVERGLGLDLPLAEADFSQPHVFNLVVNQALSTAWELGLRLRVASGIPYTPIASRSYDSATNTWSATFGGVNSQRLDWYRRLDLRLQYELSSSLKYFLRDWTLRVEGEVLNVLDAPNATSVTYEPDYSGLHEVRQFPRIYFVGLEGEF
jgi:hypothetical protein